MAPIESNQLREEDGDRVLDDETEALILAGVRRALGDNQMHRRLSKQSWIQHGVVMVLYLAVLILVVWPQISLHASGGIAGFLTLLTAMGVFVVFGFSMWFSPLGRAERRENQTVRLARQRVFHDRREVALVRARKGLAWWATEGALLQDPARLLNYVSLHGDSAIARAPAIATTYHDTGDPCATIAGARRLAQVALREMPEEVMRFIGGTEQPTLDRVADVLLRHHAFEFEVLLPKARELRSAGKPSSDAPDFKKMAEDVVARVAPTNPVDYALGVELIHNEIKRMKLAVPSHDPARDARRADLDVVLKLALNTYDHSHSAPLAEPTWEERVARARQRIKTEADIAAEVEKDCSDYDAKLKADGVEATRRLFLVSDFRRKMRAALADVFAGEKK